MISRYGKWWSSPAAPAAVSSIGNVDGQKWRHRDRSETFGYPASSITVASGAFNKEGMADGIVIFVNKSNPLSRLTIGQLDAIFGAERTGAFHGFKWMLRKGEP